jgi:uncharacterized protein DUF4328
VSNPYAGAPIPYGQRPPLVMPRYRPLRRSAIASILLMGLTCLAAVVQCIVLWSTYEDVKRFVYGLLSEDEVDQGIQSISGAGPWLNLVSYLFLGTGIVFLVWLWRARENTEALPGVYQQQPAYPGAYPLIGQPAGPHRHAQGWVVGSWFCPIVQFWYPLQIMQDVVLASEPEPSPGAVRPGRLNRLLYGWWGAWTTFWVILVGGSGLAGFSFVVWVVRLVDASDTADATGNFVDIYDLQDFMVRAALAVNIGFTAATVFLIAAGVMLSVVMLRVTAWQDKRGRTIGPAPTGQPFGQPPYGPAYGPRYGSQPGFYPGSHPGQPGQAGQTGQQLAPPSFPSYGSYQPHGGSQQQAPSDSPPWQGSS